MNRLAQFLHYAQQVFELKRRLRAVRDTRPWPQIPPTPVLLTLVLGAVLRRSSYLDLAQQTQRRRWRRLCGLPRALSHDLWAYVTERLWVEDLRQTIADLLKTLKANKALESCKLHGLFFLSLDANEPFKSRSRTCPGCCQRSVEETDAAGHKHTVTESYHRYVFAHLHGAKLSVLVEVEPIRPGEEECAAALRLLVRVRRLYGPRFFDVITADGWYAKGPFLRAVRQLGWAWVVVLKRQDMEVYQEALALSQGQQPGADFEDAERHRQVQLWEVKDLKFSPGYTPPVRVVRSQEQWVEKRIRGGRPQREARQSRWLWAASDELNGDAAAVIDQAGHRRWGIENEAFNQLTQGYHLEHCYHHEPTAMLAQMLILMLGFLLFSAFAQWRSKLVVLGKWTARALAHELDLALEAELLWEQWFHCG